MPRKSVRQLDLNGRRVLIRADLNVPLDAEQRITDDQRIAKFLPTLELVVQAGGRAIVMSHLGRPDGKPQPAMSLRPVATRIEQRLGRPCGFVEDCIGPAADQAVAQVEPGGVLLLENLRFHAGETIIDNVKKNPDGRLTADEEAARAAFAAALARHADVYVNDAFGTCHRQHVSMYDIPVAVGRANTAVGLLVEKELQYLGAALETPQRPFVAVLGGAKVSDKIGVIRNLIPRVDQILIGGAMTYTFWAAQGRGIGKSLCEPDKLDLARELIAEAGDKLHLPTDSLAGPSFAAGNEQTIAGDLPDDLMGLDIGPETLASYAAIIRAARTVVWNGPVGAFELKPFDTGTFGLAAAIADATDAGATTIIGGGDSAAAVEQAGLADRMSHISTGGGASLKFLEGKSFKPLEVIDEA